MTMRNIPLDQLEAAVQHAEARIAERDAKAPELDREGANQLLDTFLFNKDRLAGAALIMVAKPGAALVNTETGIPARFLSVCFSRPGEAEMALGLVAKKVAADLLGPL